MIKKQFVIWKHDLYMSTKLRNFLVKFPSLGQIFGFDQCEIEIEFSMTC